MLCVHVCTEVKLSPEIEIYLLQQSSLQMGHVRIVPTCMSALLTSAFKLWRADAPCSCLGVFMPNVINMLKYCISYFSAYTSLPWRTTQTHSHTEAIPQFLVALLIFVRLLMA